MGYDYLWGGHPQYGPAMGASPGHGMHQKQPAPGMAQPQSQHHFQGHGQYQLNGGVEGSHQPPVTGPPNIPHAAGQYWNRSNPSQQYNSHSIYGSYHSHAHPGITPSQHHQQQQSVQPPPHQPSQPHPHPHRLPHHHQQHQQPQHYGMLPNGMPYYQHQPQQSQTQGQAQMLPPATQNYTPPRGSPQHHSVGGGGTGSPLPAGMSSVSMMLPSTAQDSGSPKSQSRERSPHAGNVAKSASIQGKDAHSVCLRYILLCISGLLSSTHVFCHIWWKLICHEMSSVYVQTPHLFFVWSCGLH